MQFFQFAASKAHYILISLLGLFTLLLPSISFAQQEFVGQWYQVSADLQFSRQT